MRCMAAVHIDENMYMNRSWRITLDHTQNMTDIYDPACNQAAWSIRLDDLFGDCQRLRRACGRAAVAHSGLSGVHVQPCGILWVMGCSSKRSRVSGAVEAECLHAFRVLACIQMHAQCCMQHCTCMELWSNYILALDVSTITALSQH